MRHHVPTTSGDRHPTGLTVLSCLFLSLEHIPLSAPAFKVHAVITKENVPIQGRTFH